jgi:hypothetical protein
MADYWWWPSQEPKWWWSGRIPKTGLPLLLQVLGSDSFFRQHVDPWPVLLKRMLELP